MRHLVQIVPELPPAVGGVGDYASLLASELRRLGVETGFVLPERPGRAKCGQRVSNVSRYPPRASALAQRLDALRPDAVLVQFSGYGFSPRGCPASLVAGLRRWRRQLSRSKLVVMFHELYAGGRVPWRSSFWLSPLQRGLARALARSADRCVTNCAAHQRVLRQWRPDSDQILVLPVPSNVGEPDEISPVHAREPVAVVFGHPRRRLNVYQRMPMFLPLLQRAGVRAVEDIGPPLDRRLDAFPLPVRVHGVVAPEEVSALLARARFGLLHLPSQLMGKSGCFAAFAAHGTVCLLSDDHNSAPADGLVEGRHFVRVVSSSPTQLDAGGLEAMAAAALRWYSGHRLESVARQLLHALF